jgi:hypothetical protein
MGFAHRAFVAAGVGVAVLAIAGCGNSGGRLLSQSEANRLTADLNNVQQALDGGDCTLADRYLAAFQNSVNQLGGVNSTLLANLNQGESTIQSLTSASSECRSGTTTTPRTHTTKTHTSSTTTTTATQTVPTFTEPTTTYPTQTYTTPTYTEPTTTNGGQGLGTTSTSDTTSTSTSTSTTTQSGGTGLGDSFTSTTGDTTTTTGGGF